MCPFVLQLPEGILNSRGGHSIDLTALTNEMQGVRREIRGFKPLTLNLDKTGLVVYQQEAASKTTYYDNLFNR